MSLTDVACCRLCRTADLGYKIVMSMQENSLSNEASAPHEPPVLIAEWGTCVYEPVQTGHKATYLNWEVRLNAVAAVCSQVLQHFGARGGQYILPPAALSQLSMAMCHITPLYVPWRSPMIALVVLMSCLTALLLAALLWSRCVESSCTNCRRRALTCLNIQA